jgi:hypothetical protein
MADDEEESESELQAPERSTRKRVRGGAAEPASIAIIADPSPGPSAGRPRGQPIEDEAMEWVLYHRGRSKKQQFYDPSDIQFQGSKRWLTQRWARITGTTAAAVNKIGDDRAQIRGLERMLGMGVAYSSAHTKRGLSVEGPVLDLLVRQLKDKGHAVSLSRPAMLQHPLHSWIVSSPDALLTIDGKVYVVEVKSSINPHVAKKYNDQVKTSSLRVHKRFIT